MSEKKWFVDVVIPAFNEENAIGNVLRDIPKSLVREIIVIDNNSSDRTQEEARIGGATVLEQTIQGYGAACQKGLQYIAEKVEKPDIIVFLDADYSDFPEEMIDLIKPIQIQNMDMVIGSRSLGDSERGSMTPQQVFGNWLATKMLKWIYGYTFSDLGPFRAIRYDRLLEINMQDMNYGWTVEMQIKAAKLKMNCTEIPVKYRVRIGESKVSGTVKGTIGAGYKIITTLLKYA
jgi:glycosyltransferase involved in cell wall biosynthesis